MARQVSRSGKHATTAHQSAASKLASITAIPEPKDINWDVSDLKLTTYQFQGHATYDWPISELITDLRVLPSTLQASTVEIDLDDSDYILLDHALFAHWAFNIQDVSLSSTKKFKTSRLSNSVNNQFLGDNSDLEWVLGSRPIDVTIGDVTFRLCGLSTQDTVLTLTFEDRVASLLRDKTGFKTVSRGSHTRAEFIAMLCREADVPFWIPEIKETQPVAMSPTPARGTLQTKQGKTRLVTGKGLHVGQGLSAKGSPLTQSNIDVANTILDVGAKLGANSTALEAAMCAAILESGLTVDPGNGSYAGALAGSVKSFLYTDTVGMATAFFQGDGNKGYQAGGAIHLSKTHNDPMYIASQVEAPTPFDANGISQQYEGETGFHLVAAEASKIVQNYGGAPSVGSVVAGTFKGATQNATYSFTRGPNEDSYDCIQRLAAEVAWYAFVRQNRLWYVSGDYLFEQDPQMTLERGQKGIDTIDPNLDMGARDAIAQCTVLGRTDLWGALPGMVVQVNKRGPATGKWFVASLESHPLDLSQQVTATLQKPVPRRAEPAATTKTVSNPFGGSTAGALGSPTGTYDGLVSPFSKKYRADLHNTDMGVDFGTQQGIAVGDPILAIGDCTLATIVGFSDVGYQPGMFFKFVTPAGKYWGWYVAEQLTPAANVHSGVIKAGTVVAHYAASGTGIEIGWAAGPGQTATKAFHPGEVGARHAGNGTTDGRNFLAFLRHVGAI